MSLYIEWGACTGNQVFAFNPITSYANALWAKKTSDGCYNHLGLTFGRDENIVYAHS
jgi:hypothetical protein